MKYKYEKNQVFGKRLNVPKQILSDIYSCTLSFEDFIEYHLDDKIPTSCIIESDRKILEKFGIDKCKELDWELINKRIYYSDINFKDILMSIDSQTEDINQALYELVKDQIKPSDYSPKMLELYQDRLFEIPELDYEKKYDYDEGRIRNLKFSFNDGDVSLKDIINNWDLFKDKDLSYCLLNDKYNTNHISDKDLKKFMSNYGVLAPLIIENNDIYTFINKLSNLSSDEEKLKYLKEFTDDILNNTKRQYGDYRPPIKLTTEQYREIFKYSSLEEYLKKFNNDYLPQTLINELKSLPKDYIFNTSIPFTELLNSDVLYFIGIYGLKNVVDFDNECGHFFSNNDCEMLKQMEAMYLHYASNEHDSNKTFFTKQVIDENGNYIDRPYTKDEFYEAMRRMIIYGPTDYKYKAEAPDYRKMTGEFRVRNADLFISSQAPEELQRLFYTKSITPQLLFDHPEYIQYLNGKDLSSCFKSRSINVNNTYSVENFYKFLSDKMDFNSVMDFITEYSGVIDIVFDRRMEYSSQYEIIFSINDDINVIKSKIHEMFKKIIIEKGIPYPKPIPKDFIEEYPSMFLDKNAPQELQEAFYSRTISSEFILSNPSYREYLKKLDLELVFKYMPINVAIEEYRYERVNLVGSVKQIFGSDDTFDVMLLYGKYIEKIYEDNKLKNFEFNPNFSKDDLLDAMDKIILQDIIDGNMKYDESIPNHFKNNNPTLFLGTDAPQNIKDKFYSRQLTIKDFDDNPSLLDIFDKTNIATGFSSDFSWVFPLFSSYENFKTANYNRLKAISAYSKIQDATIQKSFKEYIIKNESNMDIEKLEYLSTVIQRLSISNSSEMFTFREQIATQILNTDNPFDTLNKIEDIFLKNNLPVVGKVFSCYKTLYPKFGTIQFTYPNTLSPVLTKASERNKDIIIFSDLIKCALGSNNRSVNAYMSNIDFCTQIFESILSDTNNISYEYIKEVLNKKYFLRLKELEDEIANDVINNDTIGFNQKTLELEHIKMVIDELEIFCKHLATLYNNTLMVKKGVDDDFILGEDTATNLANLYRALSPNGSLNYNIGDRVIRMFCGFAGINTLKQAKDYIIHKIQKTDLKNRKASEHSFTLEQGDFIKGIGDITYLSNILQNGSVSKEFLGEAAESDFTPLDTDLSLILSKKENITETIKGTNSKGYGPIWFVIKTDDRFALTRNSEKTLMENSDLSKYELFHTGILGTDHYGIRTGFASSEIDYILMEKYDPRVGLEIALNGFYIPVANTEGQIVFTPKDYDEIRAKMSGLSYYGLPEYNISKNLYSSEIMSTLQDLNNDITKTNNYNHILMENIKKAINDAGIYRISEGFNNDLTPGLAEIYATGSTSRNTNVPNDSDFDYIIKIDREIYADVNKLNEFRNKMKESLNLKDGFDGKICGKVKVNDVDLDVEISFSNRTDKVDFSTDTSLSERLNSIRKQYSDEQYKIVLANIIYAKKLFKSIGAYKSLKSDSSQGGLGGIGIENWILQYGGSLYDAAKDFVSKAEQAESFEKFKTIYQVWDFGNNHYSGKDDEEKSLKNEIKPKYPHDNFVGGYNKMGEEGFKKMVVCLKKYLLSVEKEALNNGLTVDELLHNALTNQTIEDTFTGPVDDESLNISLR